MIASFEAQKIKTFGKSLGFDLVSFTHLDISEQDKDFFLSWCRQGKAANMAWLTRNPERRWDPKELLPDAVSLITLGVSYYQGPVPAAPSRPSGRVARYAWGEDYHDVIAHRLKIFEKQIQEEWGTDIKIRYALDAQPLLERAVAKQSGLGFFGKNTNIIAPRVGSWIFLAELLINRELPPDEPIQPGCGGCTTCIDQCPTDALNDSYSLDARLCISYHTIENRGWIPSAFRAKMGDWIFGCDECQDVCPFNARSKKSQWPEFDEQRGLGAWIPLEDILSLRDNASFKLKYKGTPLVRPKRVGMVRNACIAAANRGSVKELISPLRNCLFDEEPVIRGHAAWALGRDSSAHVKDILKKALNNETDRTVQNEIKEALGV